MTGVLINVIYSAGGGGQQGDELHLVKEQSLVCPRKGSFENCALHSDLGFCLHLEL